MFRNIYRRLRPLNLNVSVFHFNLWSLFSTSPLSLLSLSLCRCAVCCIGIVCAYNTLARQHFLYLATLTSTMANTRFVYVIHRTLFSGWAVKRKLLAIKLLVVKFMWIFVWPVFVNSFSAMCFSLFHSSAIACTSSLFFFSVVIITILRCAIIVVYMSRFANVFSFTCSCWTELKIHEFHSILSGKTNG